MSASSEPAEALQSRTTMYVRRAIDGDREGLTWVIERFSTVLVAQARYRLGRNLRETYDAEDIVHDAWILTLGRMSELRPREGRFTPVLLKFLSSVIVRRVGNLLKRHVRDAGQIPERVEDRDGGSPLAEVRAEVSSVTRSLTRFELVDAVHVALDELDEKDQEVVLLRGIEQQSNETTATILGLTPSAATMRYKRALNRLRKRLPGSIFHELDD